MDVSADRLAEFASSLTDAEVITVAGDITQQELLGLVDELAALGLPVKEMIGGVTGWLDEGLALVGTDESPAAGGAGISCAC